ncbi:phage terminase large subunit [Pseudarthrobacter sp. PS3-L1]|uniref:phage terminase large subunit n=1 Tax=Pseudarthrobacter sp. PS3-L1 TaxID=3046207 RepID=UPI0024BA0C02|nr:phage terminase large subunit [Pseudarthrobacter sp. PS3-L1]MDJ0321842.1 phage terminase large subunit [Pseudarthrobacter sp. PS3-L1]
MSLSMFEAAARMFEPAPPPKWATPGEMAVELDAKTKQTDTMRLFDEALVWAWNTPDARLIISCPPQAGKSQRAVRRFAAWALTQNPETRITVCSYNTDTARRWGRVIRDDITEHGKTMGGLSVRNDVSSQSEWLLDGHQGGVFTAGVGASLTGRPSELMIVDDPVKGREDADSERYQQRNWDWWREVAMTRLAPGAPAVIIMTRWNTSDLGGMVLKAENGGGEWRVVNVPAQADHRPELGETDPLGREPGEYMVTTRGMTTAQWERRKRDTGPRSWAALYQGNPSPDEGGIFPRDWATYDEPLWTVRDDGAHMVPGIGRDDHELVQSWDLTFGDTKNSDFVVGQVWLRVGNTAYLLDQVRARMNFNATCAAIKAMTAKWPQAIQKMVEAKANGPAVINALQQQIFGLIPIEPEGSKTARASAISPLVFSKNVVLPTAKLLPNVEELREEAANFPASKHDDTIDAMSQAINRLLLMPILNEGRVVEPDIYDDYDAQGWAISEH